MKQLSDWFKIKAKIEEVRKAPEKDIRREYLQELGKLLGDYRMIECQKVIDLYSKNKISWRKNGKNSCF